MGGRLITAIGLLLVGVVGCGGPARGSCSRLGELTSPEGAARDRELSELRADTGRPLLVTGAQIWSCECGTPRTFGGEMELRTHGGAAEERQLGGDSELRQHGGDAEAREHGGDAEAQEHGGDAEAREHGGDAEAREHGADVEARSFGGGLSDVTCVEEPRCAGGYVVEGLPVASVYDGSSTWPLQPGQCVAVAMRGPRWVVPAAVPGERERGGAIGWGALEPRRRRGLDM